MAKHFRRVNFSVDRLIGSGNFGFGQVEIRVVVNELEAVLGTEGLKGSGLKGSGNLTAGNLTACSAQKALKGRVI